MDEELDFWTGCQFGVPCEEGGDGVVVFCSRKTNGLRFTWPLPDGRGLGVHCCEEHAEEMTRLLTQVSDAAL